MQKDIVEAQPLDKFRLKLRFEDGMEGIVDLSNTLSFKGIFESLRDQDYFAKVTVDPEQGTVTWPNGADLDPDVLYAIVSGEPLPDRSSFARS